MFVKKHAWLILCLITVVAGLALSLTNMVTEGPIQEQKLKAGNAARIAVFADADGFAELTLEEGSKVDSAYAATKGGETVGYVVQATANGYGGPIEVVLGVNTAGAVTGISVGGSAFAETAGLGTRVKEPEFTAQFAGLTAVPQLGTNVDGISGATISSSAATGAAARAYQYWQVLAGVAAPVQEEAPLTAETIKTVTAKGYGGEFDVSVGILPDGTIEGVRIGQEMFNETEGLGTRVLEQAFRDQFIGKSGPVSFGEGIDAIAGATITSNAVLNAVNEALGTPAQAPAAAVTTLDAPDADGAVKIIKETVQGFASEIEVTVGLDASNTIVSLKIGGPKFNETEYYGAEVQTNQYRNQFIGKNGQLAYGTDVDAVSGATITSNAVLDAINKALAAAGDAAPAAGETPAQPAPAVTALNAPDADGAVKTIKETVQGFASEIEVTVGLDASNTIVSLKIGGPKFNETEYYGAEVQTNQFRNQFIGKSGQLTYGTDVDAVSGATITSNAVLGAINKALAAAAGDAAPAASEAPAAPAAAVQVLGAPDANGAVKIVTETAKGFAGSFEVTVGLDAQGKIVSLTIGGATFNETEGYGAKAKDAAFAAQFIGQSGQVAYGNGVDAISGATITSTAVLTAVNDALTR